MLITFCPQMYHLLWIKFFLISAHLPTLSKKPITGVGVKSNVQYLAGHENSKTTMDIYAKVKYNKPEELFDVVNQALRPSDLAENVCD